jgi:hypothetical protein
LGEGDPLGGAGVFRQGRIVEVDEVNVEVHGNRGAVVNRRQRSRSGGGRIQGELFSRDHCELELGDLTTLEVRCVLFGESDPASAPPSAGLHERRSDPALRRLSLPPTRCRGHLRLSADAADRDDEEKIAHANAESLYGLEP